MGSSERDTGDGRHQSFRPGFAGRHRLYRYAEAGAVVKAGQQIGEVESTKTTSTIYTPVSGTIAKVNSDLKDHPEVVNSDPYGKGWMAVIDLVESRSEVDRADDRGAV